MISGMTLGVLTGISFRSSTEALEFQVTQMWNQGNVEESERLARRILGRNNDSQRAYEVLKQVASHDGKPLTKVAILMTRPGSSEQLYGRFIQAGDLALQYNYAKVAEDAWNQALKLDQNGVLAHNRLVSITALRLDSEKLIELLFDKMSRDGSDTESLRLLLNCETLDRDAEELARILQNYLHADTTDEESRKGLARCYISLGRAEDAIQLWSDVPVSVSSRMIYARALAESGEIDSASRLIEGDQEDQNSAELQFLRGLIALQSREYSEAIKNLRRAVIQRPLNQEMRAYFTDALRQAGEIEENQKQSDLMKVRHQIFRIANNPDTVFDKELIQTLKHHCTALGAERYVQILELDF